MDREQARAEYRKILAGVVRHHQAIDRHVTGIAMARIAKRLGLRVKGGIIEAGDDEMTLVSNLTEPSGPAGSMSPRGRSLSPTNLLDRAALPDDLEAQKTAASAIGSSAFSVQVSTFFTDFHKFCSKIKALQSAAERL